MKERALHNGELCGWTREKEGEKKTFGDLIVCQFSFFKEIFEIRTLAHAYYFEVNI